MVNAIDCATKLNSTSAQALAKAGVSHVGRYLSHNWKGIQKDEADSIKAARLKIISIFEKAPTKGSYFTATQGKSDALEAVKCAKELGQPEGTAIYFTVDYDAQQRDFSSILTYFMAVKANLNGYKLGAYGSYSVLNYLHSTKIIDYYFQTYAWSGGKRCSFLHIYQYQNGKNLAGIQVDFDNLEQSEVGAWGNVIFNKEEVEEEMEKAIVIGGYPDLGMAEWVANNIKAPIYFRTALPSGKIAKEVYVVGGTVDGIQGDKVINLSGPTRFDVVHAVEKFLG